MKTTKSSLLSILLFLFLSTSSYGINFQYYDHNEKDKQSNSQEKNENSIKQDWTKQDWANLNRFKEDNEKLMAQDSTKNKIVFIGNSITEGWIKNSPNFFSNNSYINRGISGQTTPQILIRFRQDVIHLRPAAVVILAGTNDIAGNTGYSTIDMIVDNIVSMIEIAKANNIKVILCSVLPSKKFSWRPELKPAKRIIELNTRLKAYATKNNIPFVDYFSHMVDESNGLRKDLSDDGVHPNSKGYKIMEKLIKEPIEKVNK